MAVSLSEADSLADMQVVCATCEGHFCVAHKAFRYLLAHLPDSVCI